MVHVDAGTQNLGGNMHDAQRGQGGVIVLAVRTPYTVDGRAPARATAQSSGTRTSWTNRASFAAT